MQSAWKLDFRNLLFDIYPIGQVDPASLLRVFRLTNWDSKSRNFHSYEHYYFEYASKFTHQVININQLTIELIEYVQ